jgi:NADPH:quinone reductase-like Zn-dependent oxidoreductase
LKNPDELLIKVHAASINPVDVKLAAGLFKLVLTDEYVLPRSKKEKQRTKKKK